MNKSHSRGMGPDGAIFSSGLPTPGAGEYRPDAIEGTISRDQQDHVQGELTFEKPDVPFLGDQLFGFHAEGANVPI